jgi:hypothetical protein
MKIMRGKWVSLALVTVVLTIPARARGAPSARLVYVRDTGAEDCPDEGVLRTAVATRLGYEPFFPHAPATLYAEVSRKDGVYRASIKLVDDTNAVRGARSLEHRGSSCSEIVDAMALSMSIAIDPHSLVAPRTTAEDPPQASESVPEPAVPPAIAEPTDPSAMTPVDKPASAAATPKTSIEPIVGIALAGWIGAAPSASAGALLYGGARIGRIALFVEGRGDLPASRDVATGAVATSFLGGSALPCFAPGWFLACGVVTVGRIEARGENIARARTDSDVHAFAGLRGGAAIPLSRRVEVHLRLDLLYLLTPLTLRIDGADVYDMPRVSAGLSAGTALHFP